MSFKDAPPPARAPVSWFDRVGRLRNGFGVAAIVAVVVGSATFVWKYDFVDVPEGELQLIPHARPGQSLICIKVSSRVLLGSGSLVEAELGGKRRFSRVAGVGGSTLSWRKSGEGGYRLHIDGVGTDVHSETEAPLGALAAAAVPEGSFLLIDPNVAASTGDSRTHGFVPRERLLRKVVFTGFGG